MFCYGRVGYSALVLFIDAYIPVWREAGFDCQVAFLVTSLHRHSVGTYLLTYIENVVELFFFRVGVGVMHLKGKCVHDSLVDRFLSITISSESFGVLRWLLGGRK